MTNDPPSDRPYLSATLCAAAGCTPVTFRAWRNRNGLFPEMRGDDGWKRFSFEDICAVRVVVELTDGSKKNTAQFAVDVANELRPVFGILMGDDAENLKHYAVIGGYRGDFGDEPTSVDMILCGGWESIAEAVTRRSAYATATIVDLIAVMSFVIEQLKELGGGRVATPEETVSIVAKSIAKALAVQPDDEETK